MRILLNQKAALENIESLQNCAQAIREDLAFFKNTYPGFEKWFSGKVLPGVLTGERTIVLEKRESAVVGLLILKHSSNERKLCTLRVRDGIANRGLGVRLFEVAFELLDTSEPLLSVSDSNFDRFKRIFEHFRFRMSAEYRGLYLPEHSEYSFNGLLRASDISRPRPECVEASIGDAEELQHSPATRAAFG